MIRGRVTGERLGGRKGNGVGLFVLWEPSGYSPVRGWNKVGTALRLMSSRAGIKCEARV